MAFRARNLFNHTTTHLVGGVGPDQVDGIVADLTAGQQMLSAIDLLTNNLRDLPTTIQSAQHSRVRRLDAPRVIHAPQADPNGGYRCARHHRSAQHSRVRRLDAPRVIHAPADPNGGYRCARHHQSAQHSRVRRLDAPRVIHAPADPNGGYRRARHHQSAQHSRVRRLDAPRVIHAPADPNGGYRRARHHQSVSTVAPRDHAVITPSDASQPAQPPTQTQTGDTGAHDVSPPSEAQPPTTSQPVSLTHTTTAIHSSYDGQVIENLDIYVNQGDAVTITNDNVTLRNVRIHHAEGDGVQVSGANNVTIENVEIINSSPPSGIQPETSENINNIYVVNSPNLTVHNATLRDGSSGIYLVNSPGADISHVDGYDFHGPFPRGQFVQFNNSGNSTLTDFYVLNHAATSAPEDNVSVYASPNVTISNGVIDGNNSTDRRRGHVRGRIDRGPGGQRRRHPSWGTEPSASCDGANVIFNDTRSFDNIYADQGRGPSASNAVIWAVNAPGVSILNSTYTDPGNPNNIVWEGHPAAAADVHEAPNATPMEHIVNHYAWS